MSTKKSPVKPVDIKVALKQLKALKIPTFAKESYDGRKTTSLTKSQKETIRKNYREFEKIATARDEYAKKNVKSLTKSERASLGEKGYKIIKNTLYVDKQGFEKVQLKTKKYTGADGKKIHAVEITRKKEGEKSETEFHVPASQFSNLQESLLQQYERGNFKSGDFMGVKIGAGGRARRVITLSVDSIYKYLVEDFEPKDTRTDKQQLLKHVTLIKISTSERSEAIHERSVKEKNKVQRKRTKNRATPKKNTIVGKVGKKK
jgi:hypothetical protein